MSRFNNNIGKNSAEALSGSFGEDHAVVFGKPIRIYKFRKLSGIVRITPQGEQSLKTDPAFYTQIINLYTSKEPVVVLWEGSTTISLNEMDQIVKTTNVGVFYDLYNNSSFDAQNKSEDIDFVGNKYTAQSIEKTVELISYDWLPEDVDISDYVYLVLDQRSQSYQWLEIVDISPNYNENLTTLENVNINFANIGIKYASSGKNILDFFQLGAIGEGYAFPKEEVVDDGEGNQTIETTVDNTYLTDVGCHTIQFDWMCGAADSSIAIYGRRTGYINENNEYILDKPYRLFLHEELFPISSQLFFNKPNANSFIFEGAQPSVDAVWKSYKDAPASNNNIGQYNILETKEVLTGFVMDKTSVESSNGTKGGTYSRENWNNSLFFAMKRAYNFDSVAGIKSVAANPDGWAKYNYTMFLNFNSYVNFSSDTFNFDYKETKKYKLTDTLGIAGGIIDMVVGGLNIGWTATNSLAPNQPMNLRFPCISYLNGMAALSSEAPLPCDVFLDDKQKQVIPVNTNVMTSHRYSLTDLIIDNSQVVPGAPSGRGGGGVWNTKYIGQTKFEDGSLIHSDGSPFEWNPATTNTLFPTPGVRWIVDAIVPHVVTNADVRLTAYIENYDVQGGKENISVYQSLFSTASKAVNDIRLWGSVMKFNYYDQFNSSGGRAKWPELALPPPAPVDKTPLYCEGFYKTKDVLPAELLSIVQYYGYQPEHINDSNSSRLIKFSTDLIVESTPLLIADWTYEINPIVENCATIVGRPVETLKDINHALIHIDLTYNDITITNYIYLYLRGGDDDECVVSEDWKKEFVRTQTTGASTPFYIKYKPVNQNEILNMKIGNFDILKTEEFFKDIKATFTRDTGRKNVNVKIEIPHQVFRQNQTAGSPLDPGTQLYRGITCFKQTQYTAQIKQITLHPK